MARTRNPPTRIAFPAILVELRYCREAGEDGIAFARQVVPIRRHAEGPDEAEVIEGISVAVKRRWGTVKTMSLRGGHYAVGAELAFDLRPITHLDGIGRRLG